MTEPDQAARAAVDDVDRLKAELATARNQLDTRARRTRRITTFRKVVAAVLVVLAAFGATASVIGVWSARTTLNTDRWVATVTPLQSDPQVVTAVSTYLTGEIFTALDVPARVQSALPPNAAFLADPLSGRVEGYVQQSVDTVLSSDQFATLWPAVNRLTHEQLVKLIEDDSAVIQTTGDAATLNLLPVVNEVLRLLEQQVPTLFGRTVDLPAITNGQVPTGLQTRIEQALGVTLPSNFAQIPIYEGDQLTTVQNAVSTFKQYLVLLVVATVAALVLALVISPTRRRTTVQLGIWLVIAVITLSALVRSVRDDLIAQVPDGVYRDGATAATAVVFSSLRQRGDQLLWLGVVIALAAYLAGPGRGAVAVRAWTTRAGRAAGAWTRRGAAVAVADGPDFARRNLDALRLGGVVVAALIVLLVRSWTGLLVVAIVLAAYEFLVTLTAQAAPEPTDDESPATGGRPVSAGRHGTTPSDPYPPGS